MTIIVDGDFLCYYQAHAMQSKGAKLESFTYQEFIKHALRTLNYHISKTLGGRPNHILFPFDEGRSWRYDYLEKLDIKYKDRDKSKRELKDFHNYRLSLRKALVKYKMMVMAHNGYEADDMIHAAVGSITHGEICILSGDTDLQQEMISTDDKEVFVLNLFAKDGFPLLRTVYQPKSNQVQDDFFSSDIATKFIDLTMNAKMVDPYKGLFIKAISGDNTDTIPSAFRYNNGVSDQTVGEQRAESFHRSLDNVPTIHDIKTLFHSREARVDLAQRIISYAKLRAFDKINLFEQGLYRNIKCILLDDVVYEPDSLKDLKSIVDKQVKMPSPGGDLGKIFKGTEFDFTTNYFRY